MLTWAKIGRLADRAGAEYQGDTHWRSRATDPHAAACQLVLEEFIRYLETGCKVKLNPLLAEHVDAFRLANEAWEQIEALLTRSGELVQAAAPSLSGKIHPQSNDDWSRRGYEFEDESSWMTRSGGRLVVVASGDDDWLSVPKAMPAIGIGVDFGATDGEWPKPSKDPIWRAALAAEGFEVGTSKIRHRIYRTVYFHDLITRGDTLDAQAGWLASQIGSCFETLERLPMPETFV